MLRDECMSEFLKAVKEAVADTSARVLIVSRDGTVIRKGLLEETPLFTEYKISPDDVSADIASYSRSIVERKLPNKTDQIRKSLSEKLATKCEGQFLWLKMQEINLNRGKNARTLHFAIDEAPASLEDVYEHNYCGFQRYDVDRRMRTLSLLSWAPFTLRPLTVNEISEAVLIIHGANDLPVHELPDSSDDDYIQSEIMDLCAPFLECRANLLEPVPGGQMVHVAHFSVREYLLFKLPSVVTLERTRNPPIVSYEAMRHHVIARMCLCYLNFPGIWQKDALGTPFRDYAASSWPQHVAQGLVKDEELFEDTQRLLETSTPNYGSWSQWIEASQRSSGQVVTEKASPPDPFCYALKLGLEDFKEYLAKMRSIDVGESSSSQGSIALGADRDGAITEVVKTLVEAKTEVYAPADMGWTPLHFVSANGSVDIARLLLDNGAEPNVVTTKDERSPLYVASCRGHLDVVELLLEKGTAVDLASSSGVTPLHGALDNGHEHAAKLLLDNGADASFRTNFGWAPLHVAVVANRIGVTRRLLEKGAEVDATTKEGWTPLLFASTKGWTEAAKLLLDHGADINCKDETGWTPIALASHRGRVGVVKVFLDKDTEVASMVPAGWTLLDVAPHTGHADVVKERLDVGPVNRNRTPLFYAAWCGNAEVVQLLFDSGLFAVNDTDWFGTSPLFAATRNGHDPTVEILLTASDIRTDSKDGFSRTLIWWAHRGGHDRVVQLLEDHDQTTGPKPISEEDLMRAKPVQFGERSRSCDACTLCMPEGCEQYKCQICHDGTFHLCWSWVEFGVKCQDTSHVLEHCPGTGFRYM
ncbi:hypothetical protein FSARC_3703 [Fusarium sarcochroum]|uniref:Ankyrin n=1 Tax=Fusarium sarcochroum TaxID=1208366 RepID=A0A8H4XCE5_9HYPO|nr:hypothetical protein FSARC_3703 [Fusarium sarcochroum]